MAISTGLKRIHTVMLTLTGLIAVAGIVTAVNDGSDEAWIYVAIGALPLVIYLVVAWIAAGFLQGSDGVAHMASTAAAARVPSIPVLADRWPRLWARLADVWIETIVLGYVISLLVPEIVRSFFSGPGREQLFGLAVLPLALVLDAGIVAVFGNSPGKIVAGLRVAGLRGDRPGFTTLLRRNFVLWGAGLAAGIPLLNLYTFYRSSGRLLKNEILIWDEEAGTRCYSVSNTPARTSAAAVLLVALVVAASILNAYQNSPSAVLEASVKQLNEASPMMVDATTRLDGAKIGPAGELIYLYTATDISATTHDLGSVRQSLDGEFSQVLIKRACENSDLRPIIDSGVPIIQSYSDNDGMDLGSVRIDSGSCRAHNL